MAADSPSKSLTITLRELDFREPIPKRVITLEAPDWEISIGRGTGSRVEELTPAEHNAWFASRVLSRRHAVLRGNPATKEVYIQDIGSMHGTFVAGMRLHTNQMQPLLPENTVTLGADVIRGSAHFSALRLKVTWDWVEGPVRQPDAKHTDARIYRNTFSADYSDEEAYADPSAQVPSHPQEDKYEPREGSNEYHSELDDEVQVVQPSECEYSIEMNTSEVRTFTVPDSDDASSTPGHDSGADVSDEESPTSGPVHPIDLRVDNGVLLKDPSHSFQDDIMHGVDRGYIVPCGFRVLSSAQQTDQLPTVDGSASAEDSYGEDGFGNERSHSPGWLDKPPVTFDYLEQSPASSTNASSVADQLERARTPSPSDAAMVKPLIELEPRVKLAAPPFAPLQFPIPPPLTLDKDGTLDRPVSAWAGHNSVLYEPVAQPLVPEKSASVFCPLPARYPEFCTNAFSSQRASLLTQAMPPSPLSTASVAPQQLTINDLDGEKKRKADQISSDQSQDSNAASPDSNSSKDGDMVATTATSNVGGASDATGDRLLNTSTSVLEVAESASAQETEMPVRKKAKKNIFRARKNIVRVPEQRGAGSNRFITTAGATVAGMAIGAVGMFLGLLALPEDYFM